MIKYINKETKEVKYISFPWRWMFTPICAIELFKMGKTAHGLVGWIPAFTIIWAIQYKELLGSDLEQKGFTKEE